MIKIEKQIGAKDKATKVADGQYFLKQLEKVGNKIDSGSKWLLQAKIQTHIMDDQKKARDIYEYIIMKHP